MTTESASEQRVDPQVDAERRLLDLVGTLSAEMRAQRRSAVTLEQDLGLHSLSVVDRSDVKQGVEDVAAVERVAREGALPLFCPEGTFDRQPGLRAFHMGAFLVAAHTGLPIVPLGMHGTRSILRDGSWFPRWRAPAVTIGIPVAPTGDDWSAAVALRDRVRTEISSLSGKRNVSNNRRSVDQRMYASVA